MGSVTTVATQRVRRLAALSVLAFFALVNTAPVALAFVPAKHDCGCSCPRSAASCCCRRSAHNHDATGPLFKATSCCGNSCKCGGPFGLIFAFHQVAAPAVSGRIDAPVLRQSDAAATAEAALSNSLFFTSLHERAPPQDPPTT